jgi:hypothetical protein
LLLLQLFVFSFIALHRFVDGDEGFYLLASRLVLMHKKPYLDFFYEQTPLLPYVYALWMKCFGVTWASAKLFSALLTAILGTVLYEDICHQTRNVLAGLCGVLMFMVSGLIFGFFPVVKTSSLAGLLLFAAYVAAGRFPATSSPWLTAASGFLLGLAVDTRSYLVLVMPVFLWWIVQNSDVPSRMSALIWFLGGFSFGIVPSLYFFISSPSVFLFNNLGFHAIRSEGGGLVGMWGQKLFVLLQTFLGGPESNGIQTSVLFFVSLGFLSSLRKGAYPPRLAFQIAVVIGIASLLPTPVHGQYFCLCVPFLLTSTICLVNDLIAELNSRRSKLTAAMACVALLAVYLAASVHDFRRYLVTGEEVAGVDLSPDKDDWRLQRIVQVSQAIDQVALPGETVAGWPGYIFQSNATPFLGFEADFNLPMSDKLTAEQRVKYRMISPAEIEADFASHKPRVVIFRDDSLAPVQGGPIWQKILGMEAAFQVSLRENGYRLVRSVGSTSIYVCCSES